MMRQSWKAAVLGLGLALTIGCKSTPPPAETPAAPAPVAVKPSKGPAHPFTKRHLYDETADQTQLIAAGLKKAKAEHKRVILDFGGDWCGDCQVLDIYFHDDENLPLLEKNFVVVHLFVNHEEDNNPQLAKKYGMDPTKGVPALAVLSPSGKVLYGQSTGEFRDMRYMDVTSVHDFLMKWKA